jgi:hypothetical protein
MTRYRSSPTWLRFYIITPMGSGVESQAHFALDFHIRYRIVIQVVLAYMQMGIALVG